MSVPELIALHPDLRFRAVPPEGVLINQGNAEALVVNGLGLTVVELVQSKGSRGAVLAALIEEYDAPPQVIEAEMDAFLDDLLRRHLLVET